MLFACSSSPTDKAQALIKKELPKSLVKPDSYDPIETKVDSAFSPYDSPELFRFVKEVNEMILERDSYKEKARMEKSRMAVYRNYSRDEYQDSKAEYEEYIGKQKTLEKRVKKSILKIREVVQQKPQFIGFRAIHRYRADNNAGNTLVGDEVYLLDKDFTQVLAVYGSLEEYKEYIKELASLHKESALEGKK